MCRSSDNGARQGFTLVELAVVIVIIGVLAAFGVPRFLKSVERSKASEAFSYLSAVRDAQERYIAREGVYAGDVTKLDIAQEAPKYFDVGTCHTVAGAAGDDSTWNLTLSRKLDSSSYGAYEVKFTEKGFDTTSNISADVSPMGTPNN
jgi:prepilin-type N-terminal cleavage/methylation domain-containing protein